MAGPGPSTRRLLVMVAALVVGTGSTAAPASPGRAASSLTAIEDGGALPATVTHDAVVQGAVAWPATVVADAVAPDAIVPPATPQAVSSSSAIVPGSVNRSSLDISATYDVRVSLAVGTRRFRGSVTISATNVSGSGIDRLELNTVMARLGALRLGTVTVDSTPVTPSIDDQTIIVPLGGVLPDRASATIVVPFSATLRSSLTGSNWLFTRTNGIVDLHRWIPWVSRRTRFNRPNHGDPFVTPVSPKVTVRFHANARLVFATTGNQVSASADGLTRTFEANDVRDYVITASAGYRSRHAVVGDNVVRVVYRPGFPATAALNAATSALRKLEARLGPYPYRVLRVAQSAGAYGMEGPGIVWIPTGVASSNLRYLVTHEIAHQWFYGLVGNDQAREPFVDEAAADFAARYVLGMRRGSRCARDTLDRSIYHYSARCYYETIYIQGGNLLDNARRKMGSSVFWKALRGYIADHRWGLVHTRTLLDALDAATPLNLRAWWGARFPRLY